MQFGGAFVNQTTRVFDPVAGGHVGATATDVSGCVVGTAKVVDGTGNVEGGTVDVVDVLDVGVLVVVVVLVPDLLPLIWKAIAIPTTAAASKVNVMIRFTSLRRLRWAWMIACF